MLVLTIRSRRKVMADPDSEKPRENPSMAAAKDLGIAARKTVEPEVQIAGAMLRAARTAGQELLSNLRGWRGQDDNAVPVVANRDVFYKWLDYTNDRKKIDEIKASAAKQ